MSGRRPTTTLELDAPIASVWEELARLSGWLATPAAPWTVTALGPEPWGALRHRWSLHPFGELTATSATTLVRSPDRITWTLEGELHGTITTELDDLDAVTFVRVDWQVRPSASARLRLGPLPQRRLVGVHERAVAHLATVLASRLGCRRVRTRTAGSTGGALELQLGS